MGINENLLDSMRLSKQGKLPENATRNIINVTNEKISNIRKKNIQKSLLILQLIVTKNFLNFRARNHHITTIYIKYIY